MLMTFVLIWAGLSIAGVTLMLLLFRPLVSVGTASETCGGQVFQEKGRMKGGVADFGSEWVER